MMDSKPPLLGRFFPAFTSLLLFGQTLASSPPPFEDGNWQFSVGSRWGQTHRIALGAAESFPGFSGDFEPVEGSFPDSVGDHLEVDDRSYADGFVGISRVDGMPVTTDANPLTTYWGYESEEQVLGDFLMFTAQGQVSVSPGNAFRSNRAYEQVEERERQFFPVLELRRIWSTADRRHDFGVTAGFSWFSSSRETPTQHVFDFSQEIIHSRVQVRDVYALEGTVPPSPPYEGPSSPPGPVIENLPFERTVSEEVVETRHRHYRGTTGLEARLKSQQLSLGLNWSRYGRRAADARKASEEPRAGGLRFHFSALTLDGGLVLNRVDFRLRKKNELFEHTGDEEPMPGSLIASEDRTHTTKFKPGAYVAVGAKFALNTRHSRFLALRARYESSGSVSLGSGSGTGLAELGGWSLMTTLDFRF